MSLVPEEKQESSAHGAVGLVVQRVSSSSGQNAPKSNDGLLQRLHFDGHHGRRIETFLAGISIEYSKNMDEL